jgi:hypothetical protein
MPSSRTAFAGGDPLLYVPAESTAALSALQTLTMQVLVFPSIEQVLALAHKGLVVGRRLPRTQCFRTSANSALIRKDNR